MREETNWRTAGILLSQLQFFSSSSFFHFFFFLKISIQVQYSNLILLSRVFRTGDHKGTVHEMIKLKHKKLLINSWIN